MHCAVNWTLGGPRRAVKALLFDMDGTMIDSRRYHMGAWRKLVGQLGLGDREFAIAERGFGMTNRMIFTQWFGPNGEKNHDYDELSERKESFFRELIAGNQGARAGLKRLLERARRNGIRTAVATSSTASNTTFLLRQMGLQRHFDAAVWSRPGLRSKPHPDFFLEAARRLAIPPARCVVFEDSIHGFWAARRAGMGLVAIAERPEDLLRCRLWTPWVARDFISVEKFLRFR
ncbi:HAD family phosphatase [bacterium]|nr:HAD family phosphatase [bacterium]